MYIPDNYDQWKIHDAEMENQPQSIKYTITIEETVVQSFELEADTDDLDEVVEMAIEKYYDNTLVVDGGEVEESKVRVENDCGISTEWIDI